MKNVLKIIGPIIFTFFLAFGVVNAVTIFNVNQGGTGVGTLTGIVKGNGTSAFTATTLPADATKYLDGTGNFSTPSGTGITGTGAAGQITYWNGTNTVTGDIPFSYTNTYGLHVGVAAGTSNALVGGYGAEVIGNNNTAGGVNLIVGNTSNGTGAFSDLFLQNNLADSTGTHYAVVNLNSSTYNSTAFGTIFAVPNQLQVYGTDGPTTIGTVANSYINFFVGGNSTTNEIARITSAGLVIGGTTATSALTLTQNNLGTTAPGATNALTLQNTIAAATGVQQVSPSTVWSGNGWGTTAPASANVSFQSFVLPVQAAVPTGTWQLQSSIGGGAYANVLTATSTGVITSTAMFVSGAASTLSAFQSNLTSSNSDFSTLTTGSASTTTAGLLFAGSSTVNYRTFFNGNVSTSVGANNSYSNIIAGSSPITIPTSTTSPLLANMVINPIGTVTRTGTGAVTNTASLYINGANAGTVTGSNYSLWDVGQSRLDLGSDATGDTFYRASTGVFTRLGIGSTGQTLTVASGLPSWSTPKGISNYNHSIFTPTTGQTVSLVNNQYNIINPAGALLALTINLPSSPANNDVVYIKFTQNITTVTYANGTVVDGITAPTAGGLTVLTYDSGTNSYY